MMSPKGFCLDSSISNKPFLDPIPDEGNFEHDGDGGWPFHNFVQQLIVDMFDPVWEVRHGSVVALREILTHQDACAGVYMLDLSSDDPFSKTKDKGLKVTVKREREIDLNMQVPADEIEPNLKRPKVEDSLSPLTVTSTIISASGDDKFDACVKVEDSERNLSAAPTNGELNFSSVKIEPQSCTDGHEDPDMAEAKGSCEDNCSMGKMNTLKSLPENCVLMNLVKVTRHSWLKNCEFLQDSTIRFLCVLSLDRKESLLSKLNRCHGTKSVYQNNISRNKVDLKQAQYKDIDKRYFDQLVLLKTTEMANKDLDRYYGALDKALMRFHSMIMEEINKIMREVWQQTYRGQNIDNISIHSDSEGAGTRSYSYRVLMHTGDAELEMRGRCSTGQKVLASLFIRLALPETFCLNCGILALDKPTTNLDGPNAESLAAALLRIMEDRKGQENFQLIVITHDERFAHLIGQRQHAERYYQVTKR